MVYFTCPNDRQVKTVTYADIASSALRAADARALPVRRIEAAPTLPPLARIVTATAANCNAALIRYAALHCVHAEEREEGDVAVFCECTVPDGNGRRCAVEIEVVTTMAGLRAALGY